MSESSPLKVYSVCCHAHLSGPTQGHNHALQMAGWVCLLLVEIVGLLHLDIAANPQPLEFQVAIKWWLSLDTSNGPTSNVLCA